MKKILKNIVSLIALVVGVFTVLEVFKLNILPDKYLTFFLIGEIVLFLLGLLLYNLKHMIWVILGLLLFVVSVGGNVFGYYYLNKTNRYIDQNFAVETYKVVTHYYLIKSSTNPVSSLEELDPSTTIQYYQYSRSIELALAKLGQFTYKGLDNHWKALGSVKNEGGYFLIPSSNYELFMESSNMFNRDDYAVLYEFDVEEEFEKNKDLPDSYNVYINAYDYSGVHSDFNMIATVNTKTHQVVLTSIPRDYYIDVPAYHMKDTLLYMGPLDPKISKDALENLFDIKIDYTVTVNAKTLIQIVDTLGGVEFCSNYDFYTLHDMNVGSYKDYGEKLHVTKGCNTYNGLGILAIARERVRIPGGDRARQENCRKIIISIMKKLASTTTLTNYDEILASFDGLYTTNMNKEVITGLIKEGLKNPNFEVIEQSVDGVDGMGTGGLGTGNAWIVEPNMDTVNAASAKIKEVMKAK